MRNNLKLSWKTACHMSQRIDMGIIMGDILIVRDEAM